VYHALEVENNIKKVTKQKEKERKGKTSGAAFLPPDRIASELTFPSCEPSGQLFPCYRPS
jgi:hypothetical protein